MPIIISTIQKFPFITQAIRTLEANGKGVAIATAGTIENFEPVFNKQLENLFIERMDGNEEIFVRLMNDEAFRNIAANHLMQAIYQQVRGSAE